MVWFVLAEWRLARSWPRFGRCLARHQTRKRTLPRTKLAFYKAQLEEIQRDVERGLLPQGEAESARAEAARRLIAAASEPAEPLPPARRTRLAAAVLIAVGSTGGRLPPLCAARPNHAAGRALGEPQSCAAINGEIEAAVAAVEARLIAKPDDGKGLGGDRAGLHALRALWGCGARLFGSATPSWRRPVTPGRLRRGSGRRGRRCGHRRGAASA